MRDQTLFRKLHHPADGRDWSARVHGARDGAALVLRFDVDGEPFERVRCYRTLDEATRAAHTVLAETLQDGFQPVAPWEELLDRMVTYWREEDPSFDVAPLRAEAIAAPDAIAILDAIKRLSDVWVPQGDGSYRLEYTFERHEAAATFLYQSLPASLPALILALRHPDPSAESRVEAILGKSPQPRALPAILSVLKHPAPNLAMHLGGRLSGCPLYAFRALGKPAPETLAMLVEMLDHEDFRHVATAAVLLADHAADDAFYQPLWAHRRSHHVVQALVRAVEVRREPDLRELLEDFATNKSARWSGLQYERKVVAERIRAFKEEGVW